MLNIGFVAALALAALCFGTASYYMYLYLSHTDIFLTNLARDSVSGKLSAETIDLLVYGRLVASRFTLLSCGVLAGLALGLIGFCLFLVGAKGEIEAEGEGQLAKLRLVHLAPGAFVLFCAMVLIGVCVTHQVSFDTKVTSPQTQRPEGQPVKPLSDYPDADTDPNP